MAYLSSFPKAANYHSPLQDRNTKLWRLDHPLGPALPLGPAHLVADSEEGRHSLAENEDWDVHELVRETDGNRLGNRFSGVTVLVEDTTCVGAIVFEIFVLTVGLHRRLLGIDDYSVHLAMGKPLLKHQNSKLVQMGRGLLSTNPLRPVPRSKPFPRSLRTKLLGQTRDTPGPDLDISPTFPF